LLNKAGLFKLSQNYFGFSLLPYPFDTILGFITIPIRKCMEKLSKYGLVLFGTGYLVCAKLRKPIHNEEK